MSFSFVLGNLLGRALASYVLVLFVCLLSVRLQLRPALRRSLSWYSVLAIVLLTLLGLGSAIVKNGGIR